MLDLFTRNAVEQAKRLLRITEAQRDEYTYLDRAVIDSTDLPITTAKAYSDRHEPADQIMVHITDVTGGFGVQKWGPTGTKRWAREIETGTLNPDLYADLLALDMGGVFVRTVALLSRYRTLPYHDIGSHGGLVVANHEHDLRTWHGNGGRFSGGNQGVGVGFDCSRREPLTAKMVQCFRATLRNAWTRLLFRKMDRLVEGEIYKCRVVAHRQAKHPGRASDPGEEVWRHVVMPVVETTPGMRIDPLWTYGTGKPLPDSWWK